MGAVIAKGIEQALLHSNMKVFTLVSSTFPVELRLPLLVWKILRLVFVIHALKAHTTC